MFQFKSQEQLIAEIHNEFDTAQERLLVQANNLLQKIDDPNNSTITISERLENIGFKNTPLALKGKEERITIVKTKEQAELIQYYKAKYPFLKFLTEQELDRICDKYRLVYAPVDKYIKDVPEKNLREIENAQPLIENDARDISTSYTFTDDTSYYSTHISKFVEYFGSRTISEKKLIELGEEYYNDHFYLNRMYSRLGTSNMEYHISDIIFKNLFGMNASYPKFEINRVDYSGLFIAAPESHFDKSGLTKKGKGFFNIMKTEVKDPIVYRYVKGGVQVLSKWGLEANDPLLINPVNN